MPLLAEFLGIQVYAFALTFVRFGAALMVIPGFSAAYVNPRARLLFALLLSLVAMPIVAPSLPPEPPTAAGYFMLVLGEAFIGFFFGSVARMLMAALETAGTIIAFQMSLSNAFLFNPAAGAQSALPAAMLAVAGITLLFVTDLHHLLIMGVIDTYQVFPPGQPLPLDNMAQLLARLLSDSFRIGTQIASPFIVIGLLFYVGLGLVARLVPQMQVFFVAIPLQIIIGLGLMAATFGAALLFWLDQVTTALRGGLLG